MIINTDSIVKQTIEAINDKIKNLKTLNVMVIGKSGVGKSTLVNALFRGNYAETGVGRPVTQEIRKIVKEGYPLAIYDTPEFELSSQQQQKIKEEILDIVRKGNAATDVNESLHCIWYCINVGGNRTFDESEIKWIKEFTELNKVTQIPIIIVLTQGVPKSKALEMKNLVEKENLDISKVVPVLAKDMDFDGEYVAPSYGLDTLIEVMGDVLPEELQNTLQNVQKASLSAKKKAARKVVATAVASAFGEGFMPVPFADAAMLVPTQVGMIAGITVIFGLEVNKSFITSFVSATLGATGATVVGRSIVSNIFKLVPGAGTLLGGLISGSTAGVITTALGESYIAVMEMVYKGELKKEDIYTDTGKAKMFEIFKKYLSKK